MNPIEKMKKWAIFAALFGTAPVVNPETVKQIPTWTADRLPPFKTRTSSKKRGCKCRRRERAKASRKAGVQTRMAAR